MDILTADLNAVLRIDCWQSVFLSKFQQELGENISLKENGTRHWRGTLLGSPSSLLGHTANTALLRSR